MVYEQRTFAGVHAGKAAGGNTCPKEDTAARRSVATSRGDEWMETLLGRQDLRQAAYVCKLQDAQHNFPPSPGFHVVGRLTAYRAKLLAEKR